MGVYSSPMKKLPRLTWLVGGLLLAVSPGRAEIEVTPFVGYQGGGSFDTREGTLSFEPGADFGLVLSLRTRHDGLVELIYSRQATTLEAEELFDLGDFSRSGDLFDLNVEYFHFGGLWEIRSDRTRPFLGLSVGATRLSPGVSDIDDEWAFSAGISGGMKYFFTDRVALRVEGRGLASFFSSSGTIFCGYPPGQCGISVSGSNFLQLNGLIGLTFTF